LQATHIRLQDEVARLQRELAEANAALRRSQALAALGEMAAGIAHEVRNPLGSIQLYVQMLAEDLNDRPAQAALCAKISRSVTGLDAIVRDVLSFSRDMTIRPQLVRAADLIERALDACAALLRDRVAVHRTDDLETEFAADVNLMTQALANIMRNAVEAMLESRSTHRELHIAAGIRSIRRSNAGAQPGVFLSVRDTGPGIPTHVIDRIFNPFFTTRATGTGLGLAIVHRIVDAHGGQIHIENHKQGGAVVEICVPAQQQPFETQSNSADGHGQPRHFTRTHQPLEHGA
jgi:signal transduction histidine kinase